MDIKQISKTLSVSPQISVDGLKTLKQQGFASIICNRPDGEDPLQPNFELIAAAAETLGLVISHIPVVGGQITDEDVALFEAALDHLPQPILAYCRTGTRSTILWSLSQAEHQSADDILAAAKSAGYDMSSQLERINTKNKS